MFRAVFLRLIMVGVIFSSLLVFVIPVYAITTSDVAQEFLCNCGCKQILDDCSSTMKECGVGQGLRKVIGQKISTGWSKGQIYKYMLKNYGEIILAAPTKKGFNLTGWITPFVAVAIAGVFIYLAMRRWVQQTRKPAGLKEKEVLKEEEGEYSKRLEKELEKFEY